MKIKSYYVLVAVAVAALLGGTNSFADFGFGQNYININTGSASWYDLKGGTALTDFQAHDFGSFVSGDTLSITGYEGETYKNGGNDVINVKTYYRVYKQGSSAGSFTALAHGWTSDQPFTDAAGNSYSTAGDQKWAQPDGGTPSLLSGLSSSGTYNVEIYQEVFSTWDGGSGYKISYNGTDNEFNGSQTDAASPWTATFDYTAPTSSVPEPGSAILALMGLGLLFRIKKVKS